MCERRLKEIDLNFNLKMKSTDEIICEGLKTRKALRSELKELMENNMKLKKKLKEVMKKRTLNRSRLEKEISHVNQDISDCNSKDEIKQTAQDDNSEMTTPMEVVQKYLYHCDDCDFKSKKKTPFEIHMRRHRGQRQFSCTQCESCFVTRHELKLHGYKHMKGNNAFKCDDCDYSTHRPDMLVTHKEKHAQSHVLAAVNKKKKARLQPKCLKVEKTKIFKCDQCEYSTGNKYVLIIHTRKHTGVKPYSCKFCTFRCTTSGYLKIHMNQHRGIKPYQCERCDFRSADPGKLSTHKIIHHSHEKAFSCYKCQFQTKLKSYLRQHMVRHNGKAFVCEYCAKAFYSKRSLVEHEGSHTGNQQYTCLICDNDKKFTLLSNFKRHMSHHQERFICELCDYKCGLRRDFMKHLKAVHENRLEQDYREDNMENKDAVDRMKMEADLAMLDHSYL